MNPTPLYDYSPLVQMMLTGLLIALGPLLWLAFRNRRAGPARRLQALTVLTLFLTFDLVLFGAFTRLTDSGLGCPDWPGCYGEAHPVAARSQIDAAQAAMPDGPVTHRKAWVEMVHRYLATGVGVLIIALTIVNWRAWRRRLHGGAVPAVHPWWPTATLVWVCIQGAFGAWTVTWKLFPAIVVMHLAGGVVLLALLARQAARHGLAQRGVAEAPVSPGQHALLLATLAAVGLQVLLGGWVSTNYAVLVCDGFPTCQGQWWPPMDFARGFEIWRPLGQLADGSPIDFAALTAIHYAHRLFAYVVFLLLVVVAWRLWRIEALRRPVRTVAALAALQLVTGLSNVVLDWPLVAAVLHTGGAAALVAALVWTLSSCRAATQPQGRLSSLPA
ncbi:COX15/CtaA family protein [Xylophilus sp. GOD-11R]|uniref:COX15/CtaA family protein n=1 Tax=Xylophilus sp. GOD-11R TaxID=3089814 RepID=UPI00298D5541|nr:COX15/CtaA family protein [Xylophilus sp. GOD-11R]WPB56597.1 COX15/CtaA family protein [Xylophilus sp. GOD-11R]